MSTYIYMYICILDYAPIRGELIGHLRWRNLAAATNPAMPVNHA